MTDRPDDPPTAIADTGPASPKPPLSNRDLFAAHVTQACAMTVPGGPGIAVLSVAFPGLARTRTATGLSFEVQLQAGLADRITKHTRAPDFGREGDVDAHTGDQSLGVLLTEVPDLAALAHRLERLVEILRQPIFVDTRAHVADPRIGVAFRTADRSARSSSTPPDPLEEAEAARDAAISAGHAFRLHDANAQREAEEAVRLETALARDLDSDAFHLAYQPQHNLEHDRLAGAEALLRWHPPDAPPVNPGIFIPLLERTGLIRRLGDRLIASALTTAASASDAAGRPVRIAVNVAEPQLVDPDFAERLQAMLQASGAPLACLEIEVTERSLLTPDGVARHTLRNLAAAGIPLALDDFGTGYNTFDLLRDVPFQTVKIDQTFVRDLTTDTRTRSLVAGMISLANSIGLSTVAEGAETQDQIALLRDMGCDDVQGFAIGPPITPDAFIGLLNA